MIPVSLSSRVLAVACWPGLHTMRESSVAGRDGAARVVPPLVVGGWPASDLGTDPYAALRQGVTEPRETPGSLLERTGDRWLPVRRSGVWYARDRLDAGLRGARSLRLGSADERATDEAEEGRHDENTRCCEKRGP